MDGMSTNEIKVDSFSPVNSANRQMTFLSSLIYISIRHAVTATVCECWFGGLYACEKTPGKNLKRRKFIFHMHKSRHFNSVLKRDDGTINIHFGYLPFFLGGTRLALRMYAWGGNMAYYYENGKILKENANYSMNINFFHGRPGEKREGEKAGAKHIVQCKESKNITWNNKTILRSSTL